jgi:UBX domain-containing protein 7
MDDEVISQIVGITTATPEIARQYAQLADNDVSQAVQLYFENGGADLSTGASQPPPPPARPANSGNASNPISLDDDDDTAPRAQPSGDYEDDEAMARRLQEEAYGGQEQGVRAPIARHVETLAGPGADIMDDYEDQMNARLQAFRRRNQPQGMYINPFTSILPDSAGGRPGIFNQQETSAIWNEEGDQQPNLAAATGGASEQSSRTNMLARLFQPPWDLMYGGSWEEARDEGKENQKWLLVNIQDGSVFDCQALNRDLWKNEGIVDTIKENFVFLQYSKDDPRAETYTSFYFQDYQNQDQYPHVAIVDPRTGEQVKVWSRKIPAPAEFLMQLHEFLDRYSLDNNARNPVAKRKSETKKEKSVDEMTEEEMLERAMQASLASGSVDKPPAREDPDDLTRSIGDLRHQGDTMDVDQNGKSTKEATPFSLIPSDRFHEEPVQAPGVTRMQIRHPGGRIIRRFAVADPVQRIYEYLKASPIEGKEGADFELISMGKNLIDSREQTIGEAGLSNGTLMVEFVDGDE